MSHPSSLQLDNTIVEDASRGTFRVRRRVFTDPAILEHERRTLFAHCWLYASARIGAREAEQLRLAQRRRPAAALHPRPRGKLNALYNTCRHRGAMVCREDRGRARNFTCRYHGWVYGDEGQLLAQPIAASTPTPASPTRS